MTTFTGRQFKIAKSTDDGLFKGIQDLSGAGGLALSRADIHFDYRNAPKTFTLETIGTDTELLAILSKKATFIKNAQFYFDQGASVQFTRTADRYSNDVSVNPGNISAFEVFMTFAEAARQHLGELDLTLTVSDLLDKDAKKNLDAREAALRTLEEMSKSFFEKIQALTLTQTKDIEELRQRLLKENEGKRAEIEIEQKRGKEQLDASQAALDAQRRDFDDRGVRHVRRYLREQMKKLFTDRSEKFALTADTQRLRRPVAYLFLLLMAVFLASGVYLGFVAEKGGDLAHVLRSTGLLVAFAVTTGFFIKWNNQWFRDHAQEEFRLKRQEIDVDRASWVVEMAMEWKEEKGSDIPEYLVDRLSRNLFESVEGKEGSVTPADALASAMLGSAAGLKLKVGDNEIQFDRKGIDGLKKE